jgi:protein-disulfide isomerase
MLQCSVIWSCLILFCSSLSEVVGEEAVCPKLWIESSAIDLGWIAVGEGKIEGVIRYMNEGDAVLEVRNITGSCDCFLGIEGDKVLAPGNGGELLVRFDKEKIESGPVKRMVRFETNDPANKVVRVTFSFEIERTDSEEIRWLRKDLAEVKRELTLLRADMRKLLAAVENSGAATASPAARTNTAATARSPDTTVYDVEVGASPTLGKADAGVTITAFMDFQCPFSVREYPKLKQVLAEYPDDVRVVFKHRPLTFHTKAPPAHAAAQLALQKGGPELFWKMHDLIMADPAKLDIATLRTYAETLKLDLDAFDKTMVDKAAIDKLLEPDLAEAKKCNVNATPTILINGLKLTDRSFEGYRSRITILLAKPAPAEEEPPTEPRGAQQP